MYKLIAIVIGVVLIVPSVYAATKIVKQYINLDQSFIEIWSDTSDEVINIMKVADGNNTCYVAITRVNRVSNSWMTSLSCVASSTPIK